MAAIAEALEERGWDKGRQEGQQGQFQDLSPRVLTAIEEQLHEWTLQLLEIQRP